MIQEKHRSIIGKNRSRVSPSIGSKKDAGVVEGHDEGKMDGIKRF